MSVREKIWKDFHSKDIISADKSWFQGNAHLILNLLWFINALDFIQHFLAAFRTFDGFLAVKGFQLGNDCFLMFDIPLLVQVGFVLGVTQAGAFFQGIAE